jgi:hypothetical protein
MQERSDPNYWLDSGCDVKGSFVLWLPDSERLLGATTQGGWLDVDRRACPNNPRHIPGKRRWNEIFVDVQHNRRDEAIIWTVGDCLILENLLEEFRLKGFTGYRALPAKVRFRDGLVSNEYRELIVTGWAGVADLESGIRLVEVCPLCRTQTYTRSGNVKRLVDWTQWTGDHFFRVWPLAKCIFVTSEVAEFLKASETKTLQIYPAEKVPGLDKPWTTIVEQLSAYLPEDLAIKYGRPLGLE